MAKSSKGTLESTIKYRFKNNLFDFITQYFGGVQTSGCSELGETLYLTSRIKDADAESWVREWVAMGERVEKRADESLSRGHKISARHSYLRACTYYRAQLVCLDPYAGDTYAKAYNRARDCFRKAAELFTPAIETIEIPFEDQKLPAYFARVGEDQKKRKTLIMIPGGDTFVEDLYAYIVPAALERDYNVLFVNLPGQSMLPNLSLPFRPDAETPFKVIVDYALSRDEVDPDRLAAYGISAGGYLVPRAATKEKRLKAIVANSLVQDFYEHFTMNTAMGAFVKKQHSFLFRLFKKMKFRPLITALTQMQTYYWRWGVRTVDELIEVSKDFVLDPSKINTPMLIMIGEHEYNTGEANRKWIEHTKKVKPGKLDVFITPTDEGSDSHCMGANISLMSQLVFDWLDETLN